MLIVFHCVPGHLVCYVLPLTLAFGDLSGHGGHVWMSDGCVGVVVVVVGLPQTLEDSPQKRWSCTWKADELVTVGVCV